jgi:light-independent protochlorophyllide reductase subunit B
MMGLEEHLIGMFRGDSEFHEDAAPSHLGGGVHAQSLHDVAQPSDAVQTQQQAEQQQPIAAIAAQSITVSVWDTGAEKELKKIPFFVRGKARRNTEKYATERGISVITTETLYESKAYFSQQ